MDGAEGGLVSIIVMLCPRDAYCIYQFFVCDNSSISPLGTNFRAGTPRYAAILALYFRDKKHQLD